MFATPPWSHSLVSPSARRSGALLRILLDGGRHSTCPFYFVAHLDSLLHLDQTGSEPRPCFSAWDLELVEICPLTVRFSWNFCHTNQTISLLYCLYGGQWDNSLRLLVG